jgi:isopenicillin N synthase-like dioxygenase
MEKGGASWRGWFPVGDELTSGRPDRKEGLYLGEELSDEHPKVVSKTPLYGKNLFPEEPSELGPLVLEWFNSMSHVGKSLLRGIALGLNMREDWFETTIATEPF